MTKEEYAEYRQSKHWQITSRLMRDLYTECQKCGFPYELNVHHLSYERLGHEKESDLIVLCKACHSREHFLEDIDTYPPLFDKSETIKRLKDQQAEARAKNKERQNQVKKNQEDE